MNNLLLPHVFRKIGFIMLPIAAALFVLVLLQEYTLPFLDYQPAALKNKSIFDVSNGNLTDELTLLVIFACLFFIAFSKEKIEDEYLQKIRLQALQISVYINYAILVLATFLVYGLNYLNVVFGNLFTILIIFIAVYYYKAHIKSRLSKNV
ncbi:MAG: hypothetical protein R2800_05915 [Flavipsychrobacter sp.]